MNLSNKLSWFLDFHAHTTLHTFNRNLGLTPHILASRLLQLDSCLIRELRLLFYARLHQRSIVSTYYVYLDSVSNCLIYLLYCRFLIIDKLIYFSFSLFSLWISLYYFPKLISKGFFL